MATRPAEGCENKDDSELEIKVKEAPSAEIHVLKSRNALVDGLQEELEKSDTVISAKRPAIGEKESKKHEYQFDDEEEEPLLPPKFRKYQSAAGIQCYVNKAGGQSTGTLTETQEDVSNSAEVVSLENSISSNKLVTDSVKVEDTTAAASQQTKTEPIDHIDELGDAHSKPDSTVCNSSASSQEQQDTRQTSCADETDGGSSVVYIHSDELISRCNQLSRIAGRAGMVHSLIESLGLLSFVRVVAPEAAEEEEVRKFHSTDYMEFLQSISHLADEEKIDSSEAEQYGITYDCPVQQGVYECAALVAGATVTAARALCDGQCRVAINWCGGWHHAQRSEASGFCYINDIVLGILTLREQFSRVLYVDLDLHHGDGVENAFSTTPHVLTVSFHKYDAGFFPGSGNINDVGSRGGKYYSVNVPMKDGLRDGEFMSVFKRVMTSVRETYSPEVVVCQCGADSLAADPMASFNLTLTAFRYCLHFLLRWNLPLLLLGGGGYHHANTARCWAALTALTVGRRLPLDVPDHKYFTAYGPDYELSVQAGNRKDDNLVKDLVGICRTITENLQKIKGHQV